MIDNKRITEILDQIADLLEIDDANFFRVRAYRRASEAVSGQAMELEMMYRQNSDSLTEIPGIGKGIALDLEELFEHGSSKTLDALTKKYSRGLLDILKIRGVGPKKAKLFYHELGIDSVEKLEKAAKNGELSPLPRLGKKTEEEILVAIGQYRKFQDRVLLPEAMEQAERYLEYMRLCKVIDRMELAGSLRRRKSTIGDIDILVNSKKSTVVMEYFCGYAEVEKILASGETKSSVLLKSGIQVDLRVLEKKSFGSALHYFTGSKAHNIRIRQMAINQGLKVSEYGVFKDDAYVAGKEEEDIYSTLGLPYIIPELREDKGEIEAAEQGALPKSIVREDLVSDHHMHTTYSDGSASVLEMAKAAKKQGLKFITITDHSPSTVVAGGMKPKDLKKQWKEIEEANSAVSGITILRGAEVDILKDGSLDYSDKILSQLDVVVASVHTSFGLSREEQTMRYLRAIENPHVTVLGHFFGRIIGFREMMDVDFEQILKACKRHGVALELNSQPSRFDLPEDYARACKEAGVKLMINSDSHHPDQYENLTFGVSQARRAWLEKKDVLNTLSLAAFRKAIAK